MPLPLHRMFYPLGYPVSIHTNSTAVLESAQESFGHQSHVRGDTVLQIRVGVHSESFTGWPPEPTRRQYNHLYSLVADGNNQALLDLRSCMSFIWVTDAVAHHRSYFRNNFLEKAVYLLLGASVVTDIHAACISRNGKGLLLCGDSGAGKSTMAYACARSGWMYTSDDTSYLINNSRPPRIVGHAHRVRFRPAAKHLFPELRNYTVTQGLEGKPSIELPITQLPVSSAVAEAVVHAIVYLRRSPSVKTTLVPMPERAATERMCQDLYSAGEIRAQHAARLEILAAIPAWELHYCDLKEGIEALESLTRM